MTQRTWLRRRPRSDEEAAAGTSVADSADSEAERTPDEPEAPLAGGQPPQLTDGLLTFGPEASLPAAPAQVVEQRLRHLEHIPDSAIDWLDTDHGSVRAISARGRMHRYMGEVREDSFAMAQGEAHLLLAVADGVGTESAGHIGSAIAAWTAAHSSRLISTAVEHGPEPGVVDLQELSTTLHAVAADRGLPASGVSTTLLVAVVRLDDAASEEASVTLIQLGDSPAWRISDGAWESLGSQPADNADEVLSTQTAALPLHTEARIWTETFRPGQTLALTSDGVANILRANSEYAASLALLWAEAAPAPSDLMRVVDATVKSFEDDRTFVGIRFPEVSR